jgi:ketosteroid isomerase-like protein
MSEAENVAVLTQAYRLWHESRGDSVDHWMSICCEDIKFGSIAQGAVPDASYLADYSGRSELAKYFDGLGRDWEMIEYRVDHLVAQGDRVVMLGFCSFRHRKSGKVASTPKADAWRFEDGKAVEFYEYFDTAQVHAAVA